MNGTNGNEPGYPENALVQSPEKRSLFFVESLIVRGFMMIVVPFHHSNPAPEATADRFNRV